jgi:alkanesulfonate monooxygenase SsuD/methylene tetrahydromethanopterin reductase-like flavin-dependent oxidoreductase (luciferase family)
MSASSTVPRDDLGVATIPGPNRFGVFIAPYHDPAGNPSVQIRRDLDLVELLDDLGFDEAWFGEHHSGAYETIASPELMIAAAAERTTRIRLGTGVNSLSYHHPYILADRIMQLDHMTRGRAMLGMGPGQLPSDAFMMGIDPRRQRDMMVESAEVIVRLLRGEVVSCGPTRPTGSSWPSRRPGRPAVPPWPAGSACPSYPWPPPTPEDLTPSTPTGVISYAYRVNTATPSTGTVGGWWRRCIWLPPGRKPSERWNTAC